MRASDLSNEDHCCLPPYKITFADPWRPSVVGRTCSACEGVLCVCGWRVVCGGECVCVCVLWGLLVSGKEFPEGNPVVGARLIWARQTL